MSLFLFLLAKEDPAPLLTAHFVALRSPLLIWQTQFAKVFSAEACAILQASVCSQQHQQFSHFSSQTLALPLLRFALIHLSFYLILSGISSRNYSFSLSYVPSRNVGSLVTYSGKWHDRSVSHEECTVPVIHCPM